MRVSPSAMPCGRNATLLRTRVESDAAPSPRARAEAAEAQRARAEPKPSSAPRRSSCPRSSPNWRPRPFTSAACSSNTTCARPPASRSRTSRLLLKPFSDQLGNSASAWTRSMATKRRNARAARRSAGTQDAQPGHGRADAGADARAEGQREGARRLGRTDARERLRSSGLEEGLHFDRQQSRRTTRGAACART